MQLLLFGATENKNGKWNGLGISEAGIFANQQPKSDIEMSV